MQRWLAGLRTAFTLVLLSLGALLGCQFVFGDVEIGKVTVGSPPPGVVGPCAAGSFSCFGQTLLECTGDATTQSAVADVCESADLCDSANGQCRECDPGARRCSPRSDGEHYQICNTRGRFEDDAKTPPCGPGECGPTGCAPCQPGAVQCQGKTLLQCQATQKWEKREDCLSAALCAKALESVQTQSIPPQCPEGCSEPNGYRCADTTGKGGTELQRCDKNQLGWMQVDSCPTEAVCRETATRASTSAPGTVTECVAGCEPAGAYRCTGMKLERCNVEQTRWVEELVCEPPTECNPARGACTPPCTPGEYQCNDRELRRCTSARTWEVVCTSAHSALCDQVGQTCHPPVCQPGQVECHGPQANILEKCSDDLKGWVMQETCASGPLCNATDKKCSPKTCEPGAFLCTGQELSRCNADATKYEPVKVCPEGNFCDATVGNCQTACSSPLACNGRELQTCTAAEGWKPKAICLSEALCKCAATGMCPNGIGADGCGVPVCASNEYQCAGDPSRPEVRKCANSRAAWEGTNWFCENGLCDVGNPATNTSGACLACATAGELHCQGTTLQVCSNDRRYWSTKANCNPYTCQDRGTNDFCATCNAGDRWCEGRQPRKCPASLTGGENDGDLCASAALCVSKNNSDKKCNEPTCQPGERQCGANGQPEVCNNEQTGWVAQGNRCRRADLCVNGVCSECNATDRACNGRQPQKCNANGTGYVDDTAVAPCATAALCKNGVCTPKTCDPNQYECDGRQLKVCNANQNGWDPVAQCETAGLCQASKATGACAPPICEAGATRCPTTGPDSVIEQCNSDRTAWVASMCGSSQPHCVGGSCRECTSADASTCSQGQVRRCVNNAWTLQSCGTMERCEGGACVNVPPPECTPDARRCASNNSAVQICGSNGMWGAAMTCTSPTTLCTGGQCVAPPECENGARECLNNAHRVCTNQKWVTTECRGETPVCVAAGCRECSGNEAPTCDGTNNRIKSCGTNNMWSYEDCAENTVCQGAVCTPADPSPPDPPPAQ